MVALNLSPELFDTLQELALADRLSVDELIENLLTEYAQVRKFMDEEKPGEEEIAAVLESIAEAEQPDAGWYSQEEVEAEINAMIDSYKPGSSKAS